LFLHQAALIEKLAAAKARDEEAKKVADRDAELKRREDGRHMQAAAANLKSRQERAAMQASRLELQRQQEEKVEDVAISECDCDTLHVTRIANAVAHIMIICFDHINTSIRHIFTPVA
jgi:hypothetical protein